VTGGAGAPDASPLTLSVMLAVPDAAAAAAWYEGALGAVRLWDLGSVVGLELAGAAFFLHEATGEAFEAPAALGATTARVEVFTDDPDALIARAVAAGATASPGAPRDHELAWGTHRQGGFIDPAGHVWSVGDRSPLAPHP